MYQPDLSPFHMTHDPKNYFFLYLNKGVFSYLKSALIYFACLDSCMHSLPKYSVWKTASSILTFQVILTLVQNSVFDPLIADTTSTFFLRYNVHIFGSSQVAFFVAIWPQGDLQGYILPSKHFWVLQMFERKNFVKVKNDGYENDL